VLVFAAVAPGDTEKEADSLAAKVLKMRLWDDESGGRVCTHLPKLPKVTDAEVKWRAVCLLTNGRGADG
jgi:hypothetical protein